MSLQVNLEEEEKEPYHENILQEHNNTKALHPSTSDSELSLSETKSSENKSEKKIIVEGTKNCHKQSCKPNILPKSILRIYSRLIYGLYLLADIASITCIMSTWVLRTLLHDDQENLDILKVNNTQNYEISFGWCFYTFFILTFVSIFTPLIHAYFGVYTGH